MSGARHPALQAEHHQNKEQSVVTSVCELSLQQTARSRYKKNLPPQKAPNVTIILSETMTVGSARDNKSQQNWNLCTLVVHSPQTGKQTVPLITKYPPFQMLGSQKPLKPVILSRFSDLARASRARGGNPKTYWGRRFEMPRFLSPSNSELLQLPVGSQPWVTKAGCCFTGSPGQCSS